MSAYPVISVEGDPYECGYSHGEQVAEWVARSVNFYRPVFEQRASLRWSAVREIARSFADALASIAPDSIAEMKGIAAGSGHLFEDVVALNCRTEILYSKGTRSSSPPVRPTDLPGCTTVVALPRATDEGVVLIGKNWDWDARCVDSVIIIRIRQRNKPALIQIVEAGMVGRDGLNEVGISVNGNLLVSRENTARTGVPVTVLRRMILEATRYEEAIDRLMRASRGASGNYLISHRDGVAIDFEVTPTSLYAVYPQRGLLTHANHFQAVEARLRGIDSLYLADSFYRDFLARELLEERIGSLTAADVKDVLKNHFGYPRSICRHLHDDDAVDELMTIASVVIEPAAGKLHASSGPPCECAYQEVSL